MKRGLAILLEQGFQKIKVNNGLLDFTKPTTNSGTPTNTVTPTNERLTSLQQIAKDAGEPYKKGEQGRTVARVKGLLNYTKDKTLLFDDDFESFVKQYQTTNKLTPTGQIDKELVCKLQPGFCTSSTTQNQTTQTVQSGQLPAVVKKLNTYLTRFSETEQPSRDDCVLLIDQYVYQAKNYRLSQNTNVSSTQLEPFKKQIQSCKRFHPSLAFKFKSMIEITKDSQSPFFIDINNSQPKGTEQNK